MKSENAKGYFFSSFLCVSLLSLVRSDNIRRNDKGLHTLRHSTCNRRKHVNLFLGTVQNDDSYAVIFRRALLQTIRICVFFLVNFFSTSTKSSRSKVEDIEILRVWKRKEKKQAKQFVWKLGSSGVNPQLIRAKAGDQSRPISISLKKRRVYRSALTHFLWKTINKFESERNSREREPHAWNGEPSVTLWRWLQYYNKKNMCMYTLQVRDSLSLFRREQDGASKRRAVCCHERHVRRQAETRPGDKKKKKKHFLFHQNVITSRLTNFPFINNAPLFLLLSIAPILWPGSRRIQINQLTIPREKNDFSKNVISESDGDLLVWHGEERERERTGGKPSVVSRFGCNFSFFLPAALCLRCARYIR